ncbi:Hypothetical predicted protein [Octopus vulgaris]|uniref:Uncharacterized protein n=1 Tax=Octopus vulgaris TaxID=6645 RepID=A0AA36BBN1_OCTVU|nr:Hypothetical predicted protein [Octopus vulgaris]
MYGSVHIIFSYCTVTDNAAEQIRLYCIALNGYHSVIRAVWKLVAFLNTNPLTANPSLPVILSTFATSGKSSQDKRKNINFQTLLNEQQKRTLRDCLEE